MSQTILYDPNELYRLMAVIDAKRRKRRLLRIWSAVGCIALAVFLLMAAASGRLAGLRSFSSTGAAHVSAPDLSRGK